MVALDEVHSTETGIGIEGGREFSGELLLLIRGWRLFDRGALGENQKGIMVGDASGDAIYENMVEQMRDNWEQPSSRRSGYLQFAPGTPEEPWDDPYAADPPEWPESGPERDAPYSNNLAQPSEQWYPDDWCANGPWNVHGWASGPRQAHERPFE